MKKNYLTPIVFIIIFSSCFVISNKNKTGTILNSKITEMTIEENNDKLNTILYGKIVDIDTHEDISFASFELTRPMTAEELGLTLHLYPIKSLPLNSIKKFSANTDTIGNFYFKEITEGTYKGQLFYVGFEPLKIDSLVIEKGKKIKLIIGLKRNGKFILD